MSEGSGGASGGIGFCGLLGIVFITLRLLDVIDWSWVWVLAPIWIPFAIVVIVLLGAIVLAIINGLIRRYKKKSSVGKEESDGGTEN